MTPIMRQISTPSVLFCVACGVGRTELSDAGGARQDLGTEVQIVLDGGLLASTPGSVRCGAITCGPDNQCCLRQEGRPASIGCAIRSKGTCNSVGQRVCDEAADCDLGQVCCWTVIADPPPTIGSYCVASTGGIASCGPNDFVACGSDDDCRAVGHPSCIPQQCRADILQSCGIMPSSYCPP